MIWAAGLIDGEGCISILRALIRPTKLNRRVVARYSYTLNLSVGMVHRPTIERLQMLFGGYIRFRTTKQLNCRTSWEWSIRGQQAKEVLEKITPYLFTKKDEAVLGLEFGNRVMNKGGRFSAIPDNFHDIRADLYTRIKDAKHIEYFPDDTFRGK